MANRIGWCDQTWNPVTGCSPVSEGCEHCYAARMAQRLASRFGYPGCRPFQPVLHTDRLGVPLRWRKPRFVFVCSMGDLFHPDVPDEWRDLVFEVMTRAFWHTYLLLTKRPEAARRFIEDWLRRTVPELAGCDALTLPTHIWVGVTAENQQRAAERIPVLLDIPALARFVSVEPMLEPVNLIPWLTTIRLDPKAGLVRRLDRNGHTRATKLDWVICGPETGPGKRPFHEVWAVDLLAQCRACGVPFWYKGGLLGGQQYLQRPGEERRGRGQPAA